MHMRNEPSHGREGQLSKIVTGDARDEIDETQVQVGSCKLPYISKALSLLRPNSAEKGEAKLQIQGQNYVCNNKST